MKPQFSNTFNMSHNHNKTEMTLFFANVYADHHLSIKNGALTDVSAQVVDEVACIQVSRDGAIALAKLLNRVIGDWGVDLSN